MLKALREFYDWKKARDKSLAELTNHVSELIANLENLQTQRLDALIAGDEKALERADKEISATKRKIEIAEYQKHHKLQYDPEECAALAEKIRAEASETFEKKRKEDEELRKVILEAKQKYLDLLAQHDALVTDANVLENEVNEALRPLELAIDREIDELRAQWQKLDRQIFELVPASGQASERDQAMIDELNAKKSELMRRAEALKAQIEPVHHQIRKLDDQYLINK